MKNEEQICIGVITGYSSSFGFGLPLAFGLAFGRAPEEEDDASEFVEV